MSENSSNSQAASPGASKRAEDTGRLHRQLSQLKSELSRVERENAQLQRDLNAILQSRTWRLGSKFSSFLAGVRRFSRRRLTFYWKPSMISHGMTPAESGGWQALDDDPCFEIDFGEENLKLGWYKFRLFGQDTRVCEQGCLYFDYGDGYGEENIIQFSRFGAGGSILVRLDQRLLRLRLDPVHEKCSFALSCLGLRPVSRLEAALSYALIYLKRQRQADVSFIDAIRFKVAQLGGWRQLRWSNLSNQISSHQARVAGNGSIDRVINNYDYWIREFEEPFMAARYDRSHSMNIAPVLVTTARADTSGLNCAGLSQVGVSPGDFHCEAVNSANFRLSCSSLFELLDWLLEEFQEENTWFVFSNAEVKLAPYILHCLDQEISARDTEPLAVYFDHDYLGDKQERLAPCFKPDWSPNAFYNSGYIGPLCVFSPQLLSHSLEKVRRLSPDSAITALLLDPASKLTESRILHIPEVQYHVQGKRSFTPSALPEPLVDALLPGYVYEDGGHVVPPIPSSSPLVSIIIPTKDNVELLSNCIDSIFQKSTYANYEFVIVDNGTTQKSALNYLDKMADQRRVTLLRQPGPFNYSALNNAGVAAASGEVLVLLNNDIEIISPDWIEQLIRYALIDNVGCVGARLYYQDGRVQHAGVVLGVQGVGGHGHRLAEPDEPGYNGRLQHPQEYTAVTAACLAVRRSVFNALGGLNEKDLAVTFNDVDLCLKARETGLLNIWTPLAELYHFESLTRGDDITPEKAARLAREASYIMQRWPNYLDRDPAYNPNLSFTNTNFALSTRYLLSSQAQNDGEKTNPAVDPYCCDSNISRVSSVLKHSSKARAPSRNRSPGLSIIILTLEKYELISQLLHSLVAAKPALSLQHDVEIEIIVGDTGSTSDRVEALYRELGDEIVLLRGMKYHFSRCNNELFKHHSGLDTVLFLNNDIEFEDPVYALSTMYNCLREEPDLGAIGPYMVFPTGRLQHGGVDIFRSGPQRGFCFHPGHDSQFKAPATGFRERFPAVTGACLMMPASLFERCNYFEEAYHVEAQDVDLCLKTHRFSKHSDVIHVGKIVHYENGTRKKGDSNIADRARFIRKWATYAEIMLDED